MSKKPNYIIRAMGLSDCDEVRELWKGAGFTIIKNVNEVFMKLDPEGLLVAQDQDTGIYNDYSVQNLTLFKSNFMNK